MYGYIPCLILTNLFLQHQTDHDSRGGLAQSAKYAKLTKLVAKSGSPDKSVYAEKCHIMKRTHNL